MIIEDSKRPCLVTENSEYDLKASTREVGQLYPILKSKDGDVIDGLHRAASDPGWKTVVLEHIDSEEKKIIARLIANFHRRQVSSEEKRGWINSLAEIYKGQGCKIEGKRGKAQGPNEIVQRIVENTGLSWRTVMEYLDPCFKQQSHRNTDPDQHHVRSEARDIIYNALSGRSPAWAQGVIERFKEEHEKELLESPLFRKKVLDMLEQKKEKVPCGGLAYSSAMSSQVQELMKIPLTTVFPEDNNQRSERKSTKKEPIKGIEIGSLFEDFIKDCPQCLCCQGSHADSCLERVRPED